jgi:hypothetical protein
MELQKFAPRRVCPATQKVHSDRKLLLHMGCGFNSSRSEEQLVAPEIDDSEYGSSGIGDEIRTGRDQAKAAAQEACAINTIAVQRQSAGRFERRVLFRSLPRCLALRDH